MAKGKFITFECGEGGGKTTQIKLLAEYLEQKGLPVYVTREPGGEPIAEQVRKILLDPENKSLVALTELLLYEAARCQFVSNVALPRLEKGMNVLSDRYFDSTTAYQGHARGIGLETISMLNNIASQGLIPDMTFFIDVPVKTGLQKATTHEFGKKDRIESEDEAFHNRVRQGYLEIAKREPQRVKVIPYVENGINEMQAMIRKHVDFLFR